MNNQAAHTSLWKTSDVIFGGALLIGLVLNYILPLSMENVVTANIRIILGSVISALGILIAVLAKVEFSRAKQPSAPDRPTTSLVQDGIFRYTRNPLYLGLVIGLVGLGLAFNIAWWIILAGPIAGLTQWALIIPEEKYLLEKFGNGYFLYAARVRRWL